MSGFIGIAALRPVDPAAIEAMSNDVRHRGTDGQGNWINAIRTVAFGHRRLAVIDPSQSADQPMTRGDYTIVFSGEIYNYLEVREELTSLGQTFKSNSDTEVILSAYRTWGEDCLDRFEGMFAFVIYDPNQSRLFCARDRFGQKPFLFVKGDGFFAFASEYRALLRLEEVEAEWDRVRLARFLHSPKRALDDSRHTLFQNVKQLLGSEKMSVDLNTLDLKIERYWELNKRHELTKLPFPEACAAFREMVFESVRMQLRSDRPIGATISGGIDSGSIVSTVKHVISSNQPFTLYTVRFPGASTDEWEYTKEVVEATGFECRETVPTVDGFLQDFPDFCWFNELPVHGLSQYAHWAMLKDIKEGGTTVILDGSFADALLGGFEQYFRHYIASRRVENAPGLQDEIQAIVERYPMALPRMRERISRRLPTAVRWLAASLSGRGSDRLFGFSREIAEKCARENADRPHPDFHPLAGLLYQDALLANFPSLARAYDRMGSAMQTEFRIPYATEKIAEFALSMPPEHLMGDTQTKRLIRESMKGVMPERVRTRWNKQGLFPPQDDWFRAGLIDRVEAIVSERSFAETGIWNVDWWRGLLRRFKSGESGLGPVLWAPLMADGWQRHYVDRIRSQSKVSCFSPD